MPFFYHNDLHCFLFCKKHCSLFVKKKRSFFFLIWKSLFWVDALDAFFTTILLCKKHCNWQMPFFYHNDFRHCFLFCKKHCSLFVKKKRSFFFLIWKSLFWVDALEPFFTTMIYVVFCHFAKNTAVCL